jgi:hypothetical protein
MLDRYSGLRGDTSRLLPGAGNVGSPFHIPEELYPECEGNLYKLASMAAKVAEGDCALVEARYHADITSGQINQRTVDIWSDRIFKARGWQARSRGNTMQYACAHGGSTSNQLEAAETWWEIQRGSR